MNCSPSVLTPTLDRKSCVRFPAFFSVNFRRKLSIKLCYSWRSSSPISRSWQNTPSSARAVHRPTSQSTPSKHRNKLDLNISYAWPQNFILCLWLQNNVFNFISWYYFQFNTIALILCVHILPMHISQNRKHTNTQSRPPKPSRQVGVSRPPRVLAVRVSQRLGTCSRLTDNTLPGGRWNAGDLGDVVFHISGPLLIPASFYGLCGERIRHSLFSESHIAFNSFSVAECWRVSTHPPYCDKRKALAASRPTPSRSGVGSQRSSGRWFRGFRRFPQL